jgi:hypothetical protein
MINLNIYETPYDKKYPLVKMFFLHVHTKMSQAGYGLGVLHLQLINTSRSS